MTVVLTGASRGIGRALALALRGPLHAVARDEAALASLAAERAETTTQALDLASVADASRAGAALAARLEAPVTLVHGAGVWPTRRVLVGGLEQAFLVNVLGPLAFQAPLLAAEKVARILVMGAGLMVKGRFDAERTPTGADFSWFRTYASTKLAAAVAMRDVAAAHPTVDVAVVHPGVVRTALGDRAGPLGWLVRRVKRRWESPEACAVRLAQFLDAPRWSSPGETSWFVEAERAPWPPCVAASSESVRRALARYASGGGGHA